MITDGYRALRESAALLDLTGRGHIVLIGEDRARLVHAMCSNNVQALEPGSGCYAMFLSAQGRILADANVLCTADTLILDTEPEAADSLAGHIDRYIIADDCTVHDATAARAVFALEGPAAAELLAKISPADVPGPFGNMPWQAGVIAGLSSTGQPGFRIFADSGQHGAVESWLLGVGAIPATPEEARAVRIENARPRFSEDFGEKQIPHETQLLHAISFNKGCYLGQEIVERVRSRGAVNRKLVQLVSDSSELVKPGEKLTLEGKEVGEVTSAALSPATGKQYAFGYLRSEVIAKKVAVRAGQVLLRATDRAPA